jgi:uncharacterized protein (DUF433 family)
VKRTPEVFFYGGGAVVELSTDRKRQIMLAETRYEHIVINDSRVPVISGTTMKVIELVLAQAAYGWSAEELHIQFSYLTLGQIYSALAYYWDHCEELDGDIERRLEKVNRIQKDTPVAPLINRLKKKGLI